MTRTNIVFSPIGVIRSEHMQAEKTPAQPVYAQECLGSVEVDPAYADALKDIEGFSHLYLLYHFHQAAPMKLRIKPFLGDAEHGLLATRHPSRANAIGLSIVQLIEREGNILHLKGVDMLDGTPLLDIKPYSARFDHIEATKNGWMDNVCDETANARGKRGYEP